MIVSYLCLVFPAPMYAFGANIVRYRNKGETVLP